MTLAVFHDFPCLENGPTKFHDFPERVITLTESTSQKYYLTHTLLQMNTNITYEWSVARLN